MTMSLRSAPLTLRRRSFRPLPGLGPSGQEGNSNVRLDAPRSDLGGVFFLGVDIIPAAGSTTCVEVNVYNLNTQTVFGSLFVDPLPLAGSAADIADQFKTNPKLRALVDAILATFAVRKLWVDDVNGNNVCVLFEETP